MLFLYYGCKRGGQTSGHCCGLRPRGKARFHGAASHWLEFPSPGGPTPIWPLSRQRSPPDSDCLDQVRFMEGLVQPDRLRARILLWAAKEVRLNTLPPHAGTILEAVLFRGTLPRGDVAGLLGMGDRQARRIVSVLLARQVLISESPRAPLRPRVSGDPGLAVDARVVSRTGTVSGDEARLCRPAFSSVASPHPRRPWCPSQSRF